jgi:hypothetical protein
MTWLASVAYVQQNVSALQNVSWFGLVWGGGDTCAAPALCISLVSEKAFPRPYDVATNIAMNCPNPTSFEFSSQSVTLDIINEPTVATAKTKSSRP